VFNPLQPFDSLPRMPTHAPQRQTEHIKTSTCMHRFSHGHITCIYAYMHTKERVRPHKCAHALSITQESNRKLLLFFPE